MNRKHIIWTLLVVLILSAILLPRLLSGKNQNSSPANRANARSNKPVIVSVQIAKPAPIQEKIMVTGTVHASKDVEIRNEISGRIVKVYFKEGMTVKAGQLLIKLNDNDLQAQLLKARANLKLSIDKEQRQKKLLEKEIISTEEYQNSLKDWESSEADVQLLTAQIEKTTITAPFTGVIGLSSVTEGMFLSTGSKIANLVSVSELEIGFTVAERHASSLQKGMKAAYSFSNNPKVYNATISAIEPKIDDATRTIAIKARCIDPDDKCIVGSFVKVEIDANQHDGILVPSNAVIPDIEGYKVYIVKNGNQSVAKIITTGYRNEYNVEITSGINPGDTIITSGAFMLRPKSKVEIRNTGDKE